MRILLIGEMSNVHWTLAEGLRELNHKVTVASDGQDWKKYKRDTDYLSKGKMGMIRFFFKYIFSSSYRSFDVVQFINTNQLFISNYKFFNYPLFVYTFLFNKKVFLSAYGDDYFWVHACQTNKYRYTPFDSKNFSELKNEHLDYSLAFLDKNKQSDNTLMANRANGIIAGLYEYYHAYQHSSFAAKTIFIPFPINMNDLTYIPNKIGSDNKMKIFIGVQKLRSAWKGTDVLNKIIQEFAETHKEEVQVMIAESLPYAKYVKMYQQCNIVVDQLYSYSPAMNALGAMAQGKILMGGGEPEMYALYGETENFPIINVIPDKDQIWKQLEYLLKNKKNFESMGLKSRAFVEKYHNHIDVAQKYVSFWEKM
ncbi:MAG: glycosyltransferase family 1 protein [Bacteroidia bacterium]|nr:glycosyltransferase family 1 protein [Bacteroidia bacterium]